MRTLVVIPARMASTRLPGKPLADIAGEPMIVHVWRRAREAEVGPVVVAAGEAEIVAAVEAAGGEAVLTDPALASGSDRVRAAVAALDPERTFEAIINLQGDLPTIDPAHIRKVAEVLDRRRPDIVTLAAPLRDGERDDPNVVKVTVASRDPTGAEPSLDFMRRPTDNRPLFHHIGIYGYRRDALERFVGLPPSPREQRERLEQLRALDAKMTMLVALVDTVPTGVDTPADLNAARRALEKRTS